MNARAFLTLHIECKGILVLIFGPRRYQLPYPSEKILLLPTKINKLVVCCLTAGENFTMTAVPISMAYEEEVAGGGVSKVVAVLACAALAAFYVAILYAPALILRLPPPTSYKLFMIRRFICAAISSVVSVIVSALILRVKWNVQELSGAYGIRSDHLWEALVLPVSLTSLLYSGSFLLKFLQLLDSCGQFQYSSMNSILALPRIIISWMLSLATDISTWRNLIVAPFTEELVFRACMIPLLLCGGFSTYSAVFLCPVFFSLAHLNHLLEYYAQKNYSIWKAALAAGFQLGYTVVFGSYASFLFTRTGHLIAPLVSHMFCNYMGFPAIYSPRKGIVTLTSIAGLLGFLWLLFPLTSPHHYNDTTDGCKCWHRYCTLV